MTCLLKIGGHTAHVMFDLGSSIEAISPHFANACGIKVFKLENQEHLQLGTIGSRAKFEFGMWSPISVGETNIDTWWDVVNIDKYSGIIGSRWMRRNKVVLDYICDLIIINGHQVPALMANEDAAQLSRRMAMR